VNGSAGQPPGSVPSQPIELIVVGCSAGTAEGYANALRNQGQAAHVRLAGSLDALRTLLAAARGDIAIIDVDAGDDTDPAGAVAALRSAAPHCAVILVARDPSSHTDLLTGSTAQDLVPVDDTARVAHAIRREHASLALQAELRRMRRQLDESEQRNRQLVESSRDAIAYIHDGIFLQANRAFLQRFAYEVSDELDGLPIMDLIHPDARAAFKAALRKVEAGQDHAETFHCVPSAGESFDETLELTPALIDGESCAQVLIRDRSQDVDLQRRIEELSVTDPQTGFLNRQAFTARLEQWLAGSDGGRRAALLQLSISNYAELREECGFALSDQLLPEVADVVRSACPSAESIARFGDHDFMLLYDADASPRAAAEQCLEKLRSHVFEATGDATLRPVFVIGLAQSGPAGSRGVASLELVNRACRAQGLARSLGEFCVASFDHQAAEQPGASAAADNAILRELDVALAGDSFRLKFQPIVSLQGDTRENYAVYLRLVDSQGKEVVPDRFLGPAAAAGRLADIDRWVVRNGIREMASHRRDGRKIVFFVTLSRAAIEDGSMLLWICDCLREFRAKGSWFVFQFHDADLRETLPAARELVLGLRRINCRIALSRFTEPATVLLNQLEVDFVKLAPEYLDGLVGNANRQDRLQRVNAMLQTNGYQTIATGVEEAAVLAVLWGVRVNYIQGDFLQEPSSNIVFDAAP
jgi:PAS domain S-box-containing protein/diguanylate cyclase (GGDEF)-like protein